METAFVFGYGSLAGRAAGVPARLRGHRRTWNVAMENRRTIPGYKYYLDERTGERPDVFVTFLNIVPDASASANGVAFEVGSDALATLDRRERSYHRVDVTEHLDTDLGGPVFAFMGRPAALARYEEGLRTGRAVTSRAYVENIRSGFASYGGEWLEEFERTTDALGIPVRGLRRIPVPDPAATGLQPVEDGS